MAVFTQLLPHRLLPVGQEAMQVPDRHHWPSGQTAPQAPQFVLSVLVHTPLHGCKFGLLAVPQPGTGARGRAAAAGAADGDDEAEDEVR